IQRGQQFGRITRLKEITTSRKIKRHCLARECRKHFQIRTRNRRIVRCPRTRANQSHHTLGLRQLSNFRPQLSIQTDEQYQTRRNLRCSLQPHRNVRLKTLLNLRAVSNCKEAAKSARFNHAINQTQQQLIVGKIRPSRERQLQRERRFSTSGRSNDQHALLAAGLNETRAVYIKHPEATQSSTNRKRSHCCQQRIVWTRQLGDPNVNRNGSSFSEMDQRALQRKIKCAGARVTSSPAGNFKLVQIVWYIGLLIAVK